MIYQLAFLLMAIVAATTNDKHVQTLATRLFASILLIFGGTRYYVGCDFGAYQVRHTYYQSIASYTDFFEAIIRTEGGYFLVSYLFAWSGLGYAWPQFAFFAICIACIYFFITRFERPLTLLTLLFPIFILQLSMSGIRQAVAASILLLAWIAFTRGRGVATGALIMLAWTFHQSAIVFLPLAFLAGKELKASRIAVGLSISLVLVFIFSGDRFEVYQERYGDGDLEAVGAYFRSVLIAIPCIGFELYRRRFQEAFPKDYTIMRLLSLAGLALIPITLISTMAGHRLGFYILPMSVVILMRLPPVMSGTWRFGGLHLLPLVAYAAYIFVWINVSGHARKCYIPYDSYLFY